MARFLCLAKVGRLDRRGTPSALRDMTPEGYTIPVAPAEYGRGLQWQSFFFHVLPWAIVDFGVERVLSEGAIGGEAVMWHSLVVVCARQRRSQCSSRATTLAEGLAPLES
jgi:hypothetical protein